MGLACGADIPWLPFAGLLERHRPRTAHRARGDIMSETIVVALIAQATSLPVMDEPRKEMEASVSAPLIPATPDSAVATAAVPPGYRMAWLKFLIGDLRRFSWLMMFGVTALACYHTVRLPPLRVPWARRLHVLPRHRLRLPCQLSHQWHQPLPCRPLTCCTAWASWTPWAGLHS